MMDETIHGTIPTNTLHKFEFTDPQRCDNISEWMSRGMFNQNRMGGVVGYILENPPQEANRFHRRHTVFRSSVNVRPLACPSSIGFVATGTRRLPDLLWQTCVNQTNRGHREIPMKRRVGRRPDSRWPINHEHTASLITPVQST